MSWTRKNPGTRVKVIEYVRPKEKAPSYPQLPPKREPTEAELANARRIAQEQIAMLKAKFRMP